MPANSQNPVQARHFIGAVDEDGVLQGRAIVVVSDMVPEGRPIHVDADHTDGLPEVLVAPATYDRIVAEEGGFE